MELSKSFISKDGELNIFTGFVYKKPEFREKKFLDYLRESETERQKYARIWRIHDKCVEMGHLLWANDIEDIYFNTDNN